MRSFAPRGCEAAELAKQAPNKPYGLFGPVINEIYYWSLAKQGDSACGLGTALRA